MIFYAIRIKGTDKYLPQRKRGRGNSYAEPTAEEPPRLHTTYDSAARSLTQWLRGWVQIGYDDGGTYIAAVEQPKDKTTGEVRPRKKEEMEIVAIEVMPLRTFYADRRGRYEARSFVASLA